MITDGESAREMRAMYYQLRAARLRELGLSSIFWSVRCEFQDLADKYEQLAERARSRPAAVGPARGQATADDD